MFFSWYIYIYIYIYIWNVQTHWKPPYKSIGGYGLYNSKLSLAQGSPLLCGHTSLVKWGSGYSEIWWVGCRGFLRFVTIILLTTFLFIYLFLGRHQSSFTPPCALMNACDLRDIKLRSTQGWVLLWAVQMDFIGLLFLFLEPSIYNITFMERLE